MLAFGFSLNLLTMLAIVLSVGLVVDDAIVVVENIERHVREGMSRIQAALIGARELVGPIIAMTITLATVYAPIGFQGGLTGSLFLEFAITLAAAVVVSGFVALTLSPVMSSRFVHAHGKEGWLTRQVNRGFELVRRTYARCLDTALEMRWAIVLAALLVTLWAYPLVPVQPEGAGPGRGPGAHLDVRDRRPGRLPGGRRPGLAGRGPRAQVVPRERGGLVADGQLGRVRGDEDGGLEEPRRGPPSRCTGRCSGGCRRSPGCRCSPGSTRRCPTPASTTSSW